MLRLDLGPHDVMPENFERSCHVEFHMPNSTVSRAQIRSVSVNTEEPPDKWVHHLAKYQYKVEMQFSDGKEKVEEPEEARATLASPEEELEPEKADSDTSSSDSSDEE